MDGTGERYRGRPLAFCPGSRPKKGRDYRRQVSQVSRMVPPPSRHAPPGSYSVIEFRNIFCSNSLRQLRFTELPPARPRVPPRNSSLQNPQTDGIPQAFCGSLLAFDGAAFQAHPPPGEQPNRQEQTRGAYGQNQSGFGLHPFFAMRHVPSTLLAVFHAGLHGNHRFLGEENRLRLRSDYHTNPLPPIQIWRQIVENRRVW